MSTQEAKSEGNGKSWILTKLGWFDPPMGRVHQPKKFRSGGTPCGRGRPTPWPILLVKPKSQLVAPNSKSSGMVNFYDNIRLLGGRKVLTL